ncbi:unnamed protein product, partial [Brenthis ino]
MFKHKTDLRILLFSKSATSCSVNWHEQSMNTLTYILFLFAMGQIVPLSIITFSYVNIIRTMKRNSQRLGRVSRAEARATIMVLIMIISFTIAWTPYSLFALMEQFATEGIVSPGAGVIPALVAKSSICYDPLIYVGMNTQFRQSIKRIFGIHSKRSGSQAEKCYNNTIMSPAHKQSAYNDITVRYNSSETIVSTPKRLKERYTITSEDSDNHSISLCINEINRPSAKMCELCTIQENKTVSDAERSGDTVCDEESCTSNKKLDLVFGESCKIKESSPIVTIVDTDKLVFSKPQNTAQKTLNDVYGNEGFENSTDVADKNETDLESKVSVTIQKKPIKHSFSLDLGKVANEGRKRKFSIETKLDTFNPPRIFSKDRVVSKLFDSESSRHDSVKSYLCENYKDDDENIKL